MFQSITASKGPGETGTNFKQRTAGVFNINTQILRKTDKSIQRNMFALQRLTGRRLPMEELISGRPTKLDLMEGIPKMFKSNLCFKPSPITLEIKYEDDNEHWLDFYASYIYKEPRAGYCDFHKSGRMETIKIWPNNDEREENFGDKEWLYMSFESDGKIRVTAKFGTAYHQQLEKINQEDAKRMSKTAENSESD